MAGAPEFRRPWLDQVALDPRGEKLGEIVTLSPPLSSKSIDSSGSANWVSRECGYRRQSRANFRARQLSGAGSGCFPQRRCAGMCTPAGRLVIINQVHGRDVVNANEATAESSGDVIVDYGDGFAVAVLVADCLPILLVDEDSPTLAVVHAGWRGLRSNVLESALENFEHHDAVHAFLGPCVSKDTYQIGPEVAEHFTNVPGAVTPDTGDRSRLDLRQVAAAQLLALGLTDDHVTVATQSTDGGTTFFSDRAQRPCGRFALVARRVIA